MAGQAVRHRGSCCGGCLGWLSGTDPDDPSGAGASPHHAAAMYLDPNAAQHAPSQAHGVRWDPALQQAPAQQAATAAHGYPVPAVVPVNSLQHTNSLQRRKNGIPGQ